MESDNKTTVHKNLIALQAEQIKLLQKQIDSLTQIISNPDNEIMEMSKLIDKTPMNTNLLPPSITMTN